MGEGAGATKWTVEAMPDMSDKTIVITGANSGLGLESARQLARQGADVIMACRDVAKGDDARRDIAATVADARLHVLPLDLSDLASVQAFAESFRAQRSRLDVLMNNAGVMNTPAGRTADGFELQLGTNHLGHFALTCELLEVLIATPGSRVVTVTSEAHRAGSIDFGDLMFDRTTYRPFAAYGRSKLANLLFAYELQRRFARAGVDCISVAAHPGASQTNLGRHVEGRLWFRAFEPLLSRVVPGPEAGALSQLRAAADPTVKGGDYYGPGGFAGMTGTPVRVTSSKASRHVPDAEQLWIASEQLTERTALV